MTPRAMPSIWSCRRVEASAPGTSGTEMNQMLPAFSAMTVYSGFSSPARCAILTQRFWRRERTPVRAVRPPNCSTPAQNLERPAEAIYCEQRFARRIIDGQGEPRAVVPDLWSRRARERWRRRPWWQSGPDLERNHPETAVLVHRRPRPFAGRWSATGTAGQPLPGSASWTGRWLLTEKMTAGSGVVLRRPGRGTYGAAAARGVSCSADRNSG